MFLVVKFFIQIFCWCKYNDKYEVSVKASFSNLSVSDIQFGLSVVSGAIRLKSAPPPPCLDLICQTNRWQFCQSTEHQYVLFDLSPCHVSGLRWAARGDLGKRGAELWLLVKFCRREWVWESSSELSVSAPSLGFHSPLLCQQHKQQNKWVNSGWTIF